MSRRKVLSARRDRISANEALVRALKSHQVDAIVGKRHVMVVRLQQTEQKLRDSRDQLRALAARLQAIREEERTGIAREIHDEFGQALISLQLGLSWMARNSARGRQPFQKKAKSLSGLVTTMIQSVRKIARELRPGALDELGLVKTLRSEAREFEGYTGIRCRFDTNLGEDGFERLGSVAIFRIVQAALTNVARHARASRTRIALMKLKRALVLTIHDNGRGIPRKQASNHNSLGILGMRERALALDGRLTLRSLHGKGTTLTVRIPLPRILLAKAS